jgi:hypothetical protein
MKGKLEFNLPEEDQEFQEAINASRCRDILLRIDNFCRNEIKYEGTASKEEALSHIRGMIEEIEYPF